MWSVEFSSMLLAESIVFGFFIINNFLASCKHFQVDCSDLFAAFDRSLEILGRSFLLEFLDFRPNSIRNV